MASLLHKLLKKPPAPSPLRSLLAYLNVSPHLADSPVSLHHPIHQPVPLPTPNANPDASYLPGHSLQVYPAFPHCFTSEPVSLSALQHVDGVAAAEDDGEDAAAVWADSVKKKRKRKMNKHKYRKLRKRLRRQT